MAELTWQDIKKWDSATMLKNMKNPALSSEITRVIAEHNTEMAARSSSATNEVDEREARRVEAQQRREKEAQLAQQAAELDRQYLLSLPEDKRLEELKRRADAETASQTEAEEIAIARRKREEKVEAYKNGTDLPYDMPRKDRDEEIARRRQEVAEAEAKEAAEAEARSAVAAGPTPEEVAAAEKAAADAATAKVAAEAAAAQAASDELELAVKARLAAEEAAKPKQKIVMDFQADDGKGNPIGRRTHLEADTDEEMREKMKNSYIEAVRYAERQKNKKAPVLAQPIQLLSTLTEEEQTALQADLAGTDEVKKALAETKLAADQLKAQTNESRKQAEYNRQGFESNKFMQNHIEDFKPCQANADILAEYFTEKNLYWSAENLELAFEDETLRSRLVEPDKKYVAVDPAIAVAEEKARLEKEFQAKLDLAVQERLAAEAKAKAEAEAKAKIERDAAAAITAAASASGAAAASASATPPAENAAPTNTTTVTTRKLPAGGIEPGSLHGGRATTSTTTTASGEKTLQQIKQEIARMPLDVYKRRLKEPAFKKLLNSVGIKA